VDSEIMLGQISSGGFFVTDDPSQADAIIINTCGFIESAAQESIDEILALAELKKTGPCRRIIVTGCLPERYREDIAGSLPEVDLFLGTGAYHQITEALRGQDSDTRCLLPPPDADPLQACGTKRTLTTEFFAYLKISEGCDRHCTYCIIPKLRGRLRSREPADVIMEARELISQGIQEIVIISQDTGAYGRDLRPPVPISRLLADIAEISKDVWVRFLYGSPDTTDEALIRTIADHENICAYFDIPMQHAASPVLKRMGRNYDADDLLRLVNDIRSMIPNAAIRTTMMVGFPGETDMDFRQLMKFSEAVRFDHLGAFMYSDADDLPSHHLPNHVPKKIAKERHHALMTAQAKWSEEKNQKHIGRTYQVLVEEKLEEGLYTGRTWFQAPEVDGIVYIDAHESKNGVRLGEFLNVRITDALEYDLRGEIV
jgi:ribosomal protein S12 methylthiotransferase